MRRVPVLVLSCLLLLLLVGHAPSQASEVERIHRYHSRVEIQPDASLIVTETITVTAAGNKIKRGIYRDFPTRYTDRLGQTLAVPFDLLGVRRNGQGESYRTEQHGNGVRLYIGQKDVYIPHGQHTYEIRYRTAWQLGFFERYDELYWNVTGNGWDFFIDQAEAEIILPRGATAVQTAGYTGPQGATGKDYDYDMMDGGVRFRATRELEPFEGLTVAVAWPKGFVKEPTDTDRWMRRLESNLSAAAGMLGVLAVLVYYYVTWARVGKDPEPGVVYPRFEPPKGLSPASVRTLATMGFDNKTFATSIVSLAAGGFLDIEEDDGKTYTLRKKSGSGAPSRGDEKALLAGLFKSGASLRTIQGNWRTFQAARSSLEKTLMLMHEKLHFLKNSKYLIPGILLSLGAMACMALLSDNQPQAGFMMLWLSGWSVGCIFLTRTAFMNFRNGNYGQGVFLSLFSLPFLAGWGFGFFLLAAAITPLGALAQITMIALHVWFHHLLKAPTPEGRALLDEVEGYKLFLSITEGPRLELLPAVTITPELFEKHLPYAMALDVERQWSERFAQAMAAAGRTPEMHQPGWYHGTRFSSQGFSSAAFATAFASSFSSAIAASSSAPGKSSGSGGGGSSGGGGGGGGGGGW